MARHDDGDAGGLLRGKAALITGGEGSIGMATARAFTAEGARVFLVGLGEDELRAGAAALRGAAWAVADVTDSAQVKAAVAAAAEAFGGLDVVVSNAGISGVIAPVADYPEDVFDQVLATPSAPPRSSTSSSRLPGTRRRPRWPGPCCSWPATRAPSSPAPR